MTIFDDDWDSDDDDWEATWEDTWDPDRDDQGDDLEDAVLAALGGGRPPHRAEPELPAPGRVLRTAEDVHEHLLAMVGPERDGPRTLWVQFLDESGHTVPVVVPISDLPTPVDRETVHNIAEFLRQAVEQNIPGGSVAFALVRRFGGDRGTFEAGWSGALVEAMARVGVPVRAIVAIGRDRSRVLPMNRMP